MWQKREKKPRYSEAAPAEVSRFRQHPCYRAPMSEANSQRVAVLTGAGRGIGRSLAVDLARLGHPVALQSRNPAELEETAKAVRAIGGRALVVPGDVTMRRSLGSPGRPGRG